MISNALTIDVEEWFQVTSLEPYVSRQDWGDLTSLVEPQTRKVLEILAGKNIKATFFILGYVAKKYPRLIKEIAGYGHELAVHGDEHRLVCHLSPDKFREEVSCPKQIIEQITGQKVIGHRAPSWSITDKTLWAFGILEELGYKYDSSLIPGKIRYGISRAELFPYRINNLVEFPLSTVKIAGCRFPFSGGLFLRTLPVDFVTSRIRQINRLHQPALVYLHPWELDPDHPRIKTGFKEYIIHYYNLKYTESKLGKLLDRFKFDTVKNILQIGNQP
ncbi:MAG: DUF3473 domain-containing protein [Candidatus Schekmanbacteria bacterium]|nr:DUF3473 domain-containing protein [Candidatus Schekmanbacteria bacterium]